jgi:PAS domain S-box-containing protein
MDLPHGRMSWTTALTPITNSSGRIGHIVGITRDTTQEQRLLSAVGQRSSLMEGIDATAGGLIYLFDLKNRCSRFIGGKSNLGFEPHELKWMGGEILSNLVHPDDAAGVDRHLEAMSALADGEVAAHEYRMRHKDGHYLYVLSRETVFSRDAAGGVELLLGVAVDVTEIKGMKQELRLLSEKLVTSRSDERRRIAQDLHDSTGQHLVAAELAVARIQAAYAAGACGPATATMDEALTDVMTEIKEAEREIRVLSFLLQPPSIGHRGLTEALRSLVRGFGSRAGVDMEARIDPGADSVPEEVAIAIYRVCQEALTNVHRHARATDVVVALELSEDEVRLTVSDNGVGFDAANLAGLGLSGMRERIEVLGGSVDVRSDGGAKVVATVPRPRDLAARSTGELLL